MRKLLLYGGAFNPPHLGHERLLERAVEYVKPDIIVVTPTPVSPHKQAAATPFFDRAAMSRTFKRCGENVVISEMERGGKHSKSYTFKTIRKLKKRYKDAEVYLLIGSDMLLSFTEWHLYRRILAEAVIVAASRDDADDAAARKAASLLRREGGEIRLMKFTPIEVSSTGIRNDLEQGKDIAGLVSATVKEYIEKRGLYGKKTK